MSSITLKNVILIEDRIVYSLLKIKNNDVYLLPGLVLQKYS